MEAALLQRGALKGFVAMPFQESSLFGLSIECRMSSAYFVEDASGVASWRRAIAPGLVVDLAPSRDLRWPR